MAVTLTQNTPRNLRRRTQPVTLRTKMTRKRMNQWTLTTRQSLTIRARQRVTERRRGAEARRRRVYGSSTTTPSRVSSGGSPGATMVSRPVAAWSKLITTYAIVPCNISILEGLSPKKNNIVLKEASQRRKFHGTIFQHIYQKPVDELSRIALVNRFFENWETKWKEYVDLNDFFSPP